MKTISVKAVKRADFGKKAAKAIRREGMVPCVLCGVSIAIPVRLTGNAEGVKVGGKLALSARKLVVSALVENLPDEIVVDVTELGVGKTIFVGDLEFENLKFITPATTAVCAVRVTRASRGAAEAAK